MGGPREDSPAAGEGVVHELLAVPILTELPQGRAELAGRGEGVGVIVA